MSIGTSIKEERQKRGWTQFQLASQTGIDPRQIRRYEKGTHRPDNDSLVKLAKAFGWVLPWDDSDERATARLLSGFRLGDAMPYQRPRPALAHSA